MTACRRYDVEGVAVVVRGPRPLDDDEQRALGGLIRAARARLAAEDAADPEAAAARQQRAAARAERLRQLRDELADELGT